MVRTGVLEKFLYADDMTEKGIQEPKMQGAVDRVSQAYANYDLTIQED